MSGLRSVTSTFVPTSGCTLQLSSPNDGKPCSGSRPYNRYCCKDQCVNDLVIVSWVQLPVWLRRCAPAHKKASFRRSASSVRLRSVKSTTKATL